MKNYLYTSLIFILLLLIQGYSILSAQDLNLFRAAQAKRIAGQYEAAIIEYSKVIADSPNYAIAIAERGYCYSNLKLYDYALQDLNKAILKGFSDPLAYLNRGWAKYNLGAKGEACIDWQMAEQLGYQNAQKLLNEYCN